MKLYTWIPSALVVLTSRTSAFSTPASTLRDVSPAHAPGAYATKPFFADAVANTDDSASAVEISDQDTQAQRRALGSQELLMLPRQYGPNEDVTFPSINHVSCAILSSTPSVEALKTAVEQVMQAHPLLSCVIEGDGEPDERIDLFQMVRKGEPNPCTFASKSGLFSADDVLRVVDVDGSDRTALDQSWQSSFQRDLDNGNWRVESNPLWKLELHRLTGSDKGPCALLFSFNHAISDQSSASRLTDQVMSIVAEVEERGAAKTQPKRQKMAVSVEESVLGSNQMWRHIQAGGVNPGTIAYVAGKAGEDARGPVIMPDGFSQGGGILGALTTISGNAAGGVDEKSTERYSTLQFRTLSKDASTALLQKCRENGVSVTNALSAAATLTATDFVDNGNKVNKERTYKVLQSLDMRRFGEQLDEGETVGCLAGSMDLMHGPLPDRTGESLRSQPTKKKLKEFWQLAKDGKDQTASFVQKEGPQNAVRVFDFAMTIADLNNLVHLTAQSKDSQGRAYSAAFTNAGVYERLDGFEMEGGESRESLKVSMFVSSQRTRAMSFGHSLLYVAPSQRITLDQSWKV